MVIKWLRLLLWSFLAIVLFFFVFSFVLENPAEVIVTIVGYPLAPASLANVVVSGFLVGGAVGVLSGAVVVVRFRIQHALLKRKNEQLEEEIKKIRINALKGLI